MIQAIPHLPMNPHLKGQAEVIQHVRYSEGGQELTLILPWAPGGDRSVMPRAPLIFFVQGSSWHTPNRDFEIPMLSRFAEEGYVVATVSHRSAQDGSLILQTVKPPSRVSIFIFRLLRIRLRILRRSGRRPFFSRRRACSICRPYRYV